MLKHPFTSAVIAAAGASTRMGQDKQFLLIQNKPVLSYSIRAMHDCPLVDEIIIVTSQQAAHKVQALVEKMALKKPVKLAFGGASRQQSVQNGADAVAYLRRAASKGTAYDLCFVNWYMQGGEPFIRSVRENFPKGSLTICCSTNEKELVECQMLAAGVDCVVERPIYQEGMYRFLTELCRQESGKNGTGSEKI